MLMLKMPITIPGFEKTAAHPLVPGMMVPLTAAIDPRFGRLTGALSARDMDPLVSGASIGQAASVGGMLGAPIGSVAGAGIGAAAGAIANMLAEREWQRKSFWEKLRASWRGEEPPPEMMEQVMQGATTGAGIGAIAGVPLGRAFGAQRMRSRAESVGREYKAR